MITALKAFTFESGNYDLKNCNEECITKEIARCRELASAYLKSKDRAQYYTISGDGYLDACNIIEHEDICCSVQFTDEELQRLRTQWIDVYNECTEEHLSYDADIDFATLSEVCPLDEISDDINALLEEKTHGTFTLIHGISSAPHYCYRFAVSIYDESKQTLHAPASFSMRLTDEEYTDLLEQRLFVPRQFCYNRLVLTHPHLAQRLTEHIHDLCYHNSPCGEIFTCPPFIIHFTEIEEDAKAILSEQENEK